MGYERTTTMQQDRVWMLYNCTEANDLNLSGHIFTQTIPYHRVIGQPVTGSFVISESDWSDWIGSIYYKLPIDSFILLSIGHNFRNAKLRLIPEHVCIVRIKLKWMRLSANVLDFNHLQHFRKFETQVGLMI